MNTLTIKPNPFATEVYFTSDMLCVILADGREISVPLAWFPRLKDATEEARDHWRLIGNGIGIHWKDLDEDIAIETLLRLE